MIKVSFGCHVCAVLWTMILDLWLVVRLPDVGLVAVELVDVGLMLVLWTMNALWTKFEHYVIFVI